MSQLKDITDKLLVRSQEAILQLDLWIQQQKRLEELAGDDLFINEHVDVEDVEYADKKEQHTLYIAQLNSLYVRSKYIRDKINRSKSNNNRIPSIKDPEDYIKQLVYEFKDITIKLNEIACNRKQKSSPCSQSTKSSQNSFEPKPLNIYNKQRFSSLDQHQHNSNNITSPSKRKDEIKKPFFTNFIVAKDGFRSLSLYKSLPSSPIKKTSTKDEEKLSSTTRPLRSAISYTDGLNNPKTRLKTRNNDEYNRVFKQKNRLSLSLVSDDNDEYCQTNDNKYSINDTYMDNTLNYDSDQDTVLQHNSTICGTKQFEPLRRYNSHESILSTKNSMLLDRKTKPLKFSPFSTTCNSRTTSGSVQINCNPIFANSVLSEQKSTTQRIRSTDILNSVMKDLNSTKNDISREKISISNKSKKNTSLFDGWNIFNKYSMSVTSEVGKNDLGNTMPTLSNNKTIQTYRRQVSNDTVIISTIISSSNKFKTNTGMPNYKSSMKSSDNLEVMDNHPKLKIEKKVKFSDLQEALDTELLL